MTAKNERLIALVGPTASGKTALAVDLAEAFNGEIVCADSRTIYRGMDIGTAMPEAEQFQRVPHHLTRMIEPDQRLSAAEYKAKATDVIREIRGRGKLPFLVGGSGLYLYGVLYDFQFPAGPPTRLRERLEAKPLADLVEQLRHEDPERAAEIDLQNKRRVIRALETVGLPRTRQPALPPGSLLVGLNLDEGTLNTKIARRTRTMFQIGLVDEVARIRNQYGNDLEVLRSPGYAEVGQYLDGEIDSVEAERLVALHTRQLARRQMTWFKRNAEIQWVQSSREAGELVKRFLGDV